MKYLFTLFVLLLIISIAAAQEGCPAIVETALENASTLCLETGRNQICYGNTLVKADGREVNEEFVFNEPGNIVRVTDISSLKLSPLDEVNSEWGVALLRLQANLPDTLPGQNVTVLAFGDVQITDAATDGDDNPLQAFYFQSGIGEADCVEAPNGMLIQTPEGAVEVALKINGVDIRLGSTAYLQALPPDVLGTGEGMFTISLLEGQATVTVNEKTVIVEAGMHTTIPLDEALQASGEPSEPEAFLIADFASLPLSLLERKVELETALDDTSIIVIEGPVQEINFDNHTIIIYDFEIDIDEHNPIWIDLEIGDMIHLEGEWFHDGKTVVIIVINIVIVQPPIIVIPGIPAGCKVSKNGKIKCSRRH